MRRVACQLPGHVGTERTRAFLAGLKAAGFALSNDAWTITNPQPEDLLVLWNRQGPRHDTALRFESVGAAVIVAENGYVGNWDNEFGKPMAIGPGSEKTFPFGGANQLYALSLSMHNGAGTWQVGEPGRWRQQGVEVHPWRTNGKFILILEQRGIGVPPVACRPDWSQLVQRRLAKITDRPVKVRNHPGNFPARRALVNDLAGAWCAMTWASASGVRSICLGVPVFSNFEQWIAAPAANSNLADIENPNRDDVAREKMLDRLAWAQWTLAEIATGEPFVRLMEAHAGKTNA